MLKQLIAREPSAYLYFTLGNIYADQNRWPDAQQAYFQAHHLQPDNPDYAYNLAVGARAHRPAQTGARFLPARGAARRGKRPRQLQPRRGPGAHQQARKSRRSNWLRIQLECGYGLKEAHLSMQFSFVIAISSMAEQRKKLRLGELLVQQGLITPDQLRIALAEQKQNNVPLGRLLVRLGFVTEAAIRDIMARTIGQEVDRPRAGGRRSRGAEARAAGFRAPPPPAADRL